MSENFLNLANAPDECPIAIDIANGKAYLNEPASDNSVSVDLTMPNAIIATQAMKDIETPAYVTQFFERMNDYVKAAAPSTTITTDGQLAIAAHATTTDLKEACNHLTWLYESQTRQNKEILVWLGEIVLDYIARASHDPSVEEAIEELGFLERNNGIKWKLKTIAKWVVVAQRLPHEIRQLPVPQTYLAEAAVFSQPEDPISKIKYCNARDALLLSVAKNPEEWSRSKFVACMKELQHSFGVEATRNEGVASLQGRLICLYRLQREVNEGHTTYAKLGIADNEVVAWIYNIESELQYRKVIDPDPTAEIPVGDGLTKSARERIVKKSEASTT
jgi:hypothetical protein